MNWYGRRMIAARSATVSDRTSGVPVTSSTMTIFTRWHRRNTSRRKIALGRGKKTRKVVKGSELIGGNGTRIDQYSHPKAVAVTKHLLTSSLKKIALLADLVLPRPHSILRTL